MGDDPLFRVISHRPGRIETPPVHVRMKFMWKPPKFYPELIIFFELKAIWFAGSAAAGSAVAAALLSVGHRIEGFGLLRRHGSR